MASRKFETYLVSYRYGDSRWGLDVPATSADDAIERLKTAAQWGHVDGVLMARIPAGAGAGWIVKAAVWLQNTFGGRP